ncbi:MULTISPECIES: ABC transporter substrate-binding protein [unclassified Photobacterium]|uniref:ABC transporter substrate-binding protein n=1 Tax=unclassified Photobacterium TaxID=2628852 RepID=UPI001EDD10C0|nr:MULTISPECIES: ABC transporter substrate-binding protein [unclassified Photobacterium]MCG3862571.1 carbohydrate ABC transporter substrate-binding protein [Photobacterium sp. Ph6]MCG3874102.1 carbohydrate ABC transporter substrate-binding protein [Photobacterium sp. Ph5]
MKQIIASPFYTKVQSTLCRSLVVGGIVFAGFSSLSVSAEVYDSSLKGTVLVDSWRQDDAIWKEKIIPAFNKHYPNIKITYRSPEGLTSFLDDLNTNLANGSAGDLIACRPFDGSLKLFSQGHLSDITEMAGMENFPSFALSPWQTDSGAQTFCLPMASVIHGFFYNKDVFKKLDLSIPKTTAEFNHVLNMIKNNGQYVPLAMGTNDKWEASTMGFQNIGPNYWKGEDGRLGLINGTERFDSPKYRQVFQELANWNKFLGKGYQTRKYADSIELFKTGKAAIYPAGSWDISTFTGQLDFGVFPPPVENRGDECYFSDHTDIGIGLNTKAQNNPAAKALLEWMTTAEYAELLTNAIPGFFSLSNHFFEVENPIAKEMMGWRNECDSTIRSAAQILSRGKQSFEAQIDQTSVAVLNGTMTPEQATQLVQAGLDSWYVPQREAKVASLICQE